MLQQAVLPRQPVAIVKQKENFPHTSQIVAKAERRIVHGKNSLERHGHGHSVGISPLRARELCAGTQRDGALVEMTIAEVW